MPHSKALEVNLADSRCEVTLAEKYLTLLEIVDEYHGLKEGLRALLTEICHPLKNWRWIVDELRRFCLQNFHLFAKKPQGPEGVRIVIDVFLAAITEAKAQRVQSEAVDNLLDYLELIVRDAGGRLEDFLPTVDYAMTSLTGLDNDLGDDRFFLVVRSFYSVDRITRPLVASAPADHDFSPAVGLLYRCLAGAYDYWLSEPDPEEWFREEAAEAGGDNAPGQIFDAVSHERLRSLRESLEEVRTGLELTSRAALERMNRLPGFRDVVRSYEDIPRRLGQAGRAFERGDEWVLLFLFHTMNLSGLSSIHERSLREINRTMTGIIGRESPDKVRRLLAGTFAILQESMARFPSTALNLVENMGRAIYLTDDSDLVELFIDSVVDLGFQSPRVVGVGDDWEIKANLAHVRNIRTWLRLIELNPRWSKKLLSSLIIHLALGGVFIKDTDLFPRDVTLLLSSDIQPVFNLVKQLSRLFPAYFNEIGAEGKLRDASTILDELLHRRDVLIHFLRKQSHVESSPRTVELIEGIFRFWRTRDKEPLRSLLPPGIFERVETGGPYVDGLHVLTNRLYDEGVIDRVKDLLTLPDEVLDQTLSEDDPAVTVEDRKRLSLARNLYRMLYQKYNTDLSGLEGYLDQLTPTHAPELAKLRAALKLTDTRDKLSEVLDYLATLKELILSGKKFEAREDIYIKRHIAVDIPSMYGSYSEPRFDAMGLTFRLETLVNILFQELIDSLDIRLITRATISRILDYLVLFDRALKLDGIVSRELEHQMDLLRHALDIRGFSFSQYTDIFRGFSQAVGNIVNDYFNNMHHHQILRIARRTDEKDLLPKFRSIPGDDPKEAAGRIGEIFLRDRIATSLGLQQLDQFVERILGTVFHQDHELRGDHSRRLLDYNPDKAVTPLSPVQPDLADLVHLGAKGFNLVKLTALGLPVPPGFIVTTNVFRLREVIDGFPPAEEHFRSLLARHIAILEEQTGRKFGDPANPLLLSVRSGSSISQPGMLATFLDVGLNEEVVEGMAGGREANGGIWFAWDCYRRFLQTFGMAGGLSRNDFDAIIARAKERLGVPYKRLFTGGQMKEVALAYKDFVAAQGLDIELRPFEQLYRAVRGVCDSWNSSKAQAYRKIMGISDDWGTAVTVQSMVFGNLGENSGSGVVFTHNPRRFGDKLVLWGDFARGNQGEDVVSGLVETLPIGDEQRRIEKRRTDVTLETHFPEIYRRLRETAKRMIYEWGFGPQEIEFTFEGPRAEDLHLLQTRDMVLRERREHLSFDPAGLPIEDFLGNGIGVSGGAMAGRIVFTLDEINDWRAKEPKTPLILIRGDTVPDDIREIHAADGLLTARGGSTSHAAIVAYRLNKTCIVGCGAMTVDENRRRCSFKTAVLETGDWIGIDGLGGSIYKGRIAGGIQVQERGVFPT